MSRLTCFLGTFGFDRMYVIEPCNENGYSNPVCVLQIITCRTNRVSLESRYLLVDNGKEREFWGREGFEM